MTHGFEIYPETIHQVTNQPGAFAGINTFDKDAMLKGAASREGAGWVLEPASRLGAAAADPERQRLHRGTADAPALPRSAAERDLGRHGSTEAIGGRDHGAISLPRRARAAFVRSRRPGQPSGCGPVEPKRLLSRPRRTATGSGDTGMAGRQGRRRGPRGAGRPGLAPAGGTDRGLWCRKLRGRSRLPLPDAAAICISSTRWCSRRSTAHSSPACRWRPTARRGSISACRMPTISASAPWSPGSTMPSRPLRIRKVDNKVCHNRRVRIELVDEDDPR